MNVNKLHTELLEKLFGPIRLHILKQENELRIVHLYDTKDICRTLGVVRFRNYDTPIIKETHTKIVGGELLGKTLMESGIPCEKSYISTMKVHLPAWLQKDFETTLKTTSALYSHITLFDKDSNATLLYAELFEIIPPEILHLIPNTQNSAATINKEMKTMLGYADITTATITKNL